jgi:DNA-binding response OmpR family regulator
MSASILVVEDEAIIAAGLQDNLEMEGYRVDVVDNGTSAESRAASGGYDLILLDVMLPGKSGFEVCRAVRAAGIRTPIIMLTAKGEAADRVLGLDLGADDYITKPFWPQELLARVRAVLRRTNDAPLDVPVHEIGDLTFDFQRFEARRGATVLPLTAMELKIVRALLGHRGHVVPTEDLLAEVWGPDVHLSERVIYTHINNLRAKIEPDPAKPSLIVSVRGVGYRFDG